MRKGAETAAARGTGAAHEAAGGRHGVERIRWLYESAATGARRFRYALLVFDIATVLFIIGSSFAPPGTVVVEIIDPLIGLVILLDLCARLAIARRRMRVIASLATLADLVAIVSFLAPLVGEGLGFLRALRTLRLLRAYRMLAGLRADVPAFRRNEDVVLAAVNLGVFLFVMTGLVYETQHRSNPAIGNYADALYFTVTTLTTTGFGDITLPGTGGRLISVAIMIVGVTLFLRLAQVLFRPSKVRHPCPSCGLARHEPDAVHCKHCGHLLRIPTEGEG